MNSEQQEMVGKVCLVTGATAGIGQATALLLANLGATVVGIGRNPAKNEYSTRMIKEETNMIAIAPKTRRVPIRIYRNLFNMPRLV